MTPPLAERTARESTGDAALGEVRKLWIDGPAGRIEALVRVAERPRGTAVVAHPHPVHGGTMHNPVVFHADRELHRSGFTTLRFNFRGVGASDGEHDDGDGERGDVAAALTWIRGLAPSGPHVFVGYSFGSWTGYRRLSKTGEADAFVAIGIPVTIYGFAPPLPIPMAIVQAEHDEFGTPTHVRAAFPDLDPTAIRVVSDTSHLFPGRAPDAAREVVAAVESLVGSPVPVGRAAPTKSEDAR